MQVVISELNAADARLRLPALVELLQDAVDSGASLGFLAPLAYAEAEQYWAGVAEAVAAGHRRLLVAQHPTNHEPLATVQLDLATKPNAPHRAEVMKLLVHTKARRQGLGRQLLVALEQLAQQLGRTTLVLDTREGDVSEQLYQRMQYQRAGIIPAYVKNEAGELQATVVYYKLLSEASAVAQ
ncbi:GNAT family N-acetyltransferase [Hymenobacter humi]